MKKLVFAAFCILWLRPSAEAQSSPYSIHTIPDSLKRGANAVVRVDDSQLDIYSPSKYTYRVHQVITILNSEGSDYLQHVFGFDRFNKIDHLEITLYNKVGLPVRKYRQKDFTVQSAYDGISLVTDDKVMHLRTPAPEYPCTVEVDYRRSSSGYIELPDRSLASPGRATEHFRYAVNVPLDMDIRYRVLNASLEPTISVSDKLKSYTWEAKNIAATYREQGTYETGDFSPAIEVAPNLFEYDGYKGSFRDWKEFGRWFYDLYEEKKPFSDGRLAEIKALTEGCKDDRCKIEVLYNYLKTSMRYVSIQLGIGGLKPFPVRFVDEKRYGDCKALTNYMRYMLAAVGIPSYPALINAGYNKFPADPAFPSDPFNHVILCVPNRGDTTWLECTSNYSSYINRAGFLGSFTENKNALLITPEGGLLVRTPVSQAGNNRLITRTEVRLNKEGGGTVHSRFFGTGDQSHFFQAMKQRERREQKELLVKRFQYRQPDYMEVSPVKDSADGYGVAAVASFDRLFEFNAGSRHFYPLTLYKINDEKLKSGTSRTAPYLFEAPYEKWDTTIYFLPEGAVPEKLPVKKDLANEFLHFKREASYDGKARMLQLVTGLTLKHSIIPPRAFAQLAELLAVVEKEEGVKLITVQQEGGALPRTFIP